MSSDRWILYQPSDGTVLGRFHGVSGSAAQQRPGTGLALLVVDAQTYDMQGRPEPEAQALFLSGLRAAMWDKVKAERARRRAMPLVTAVGVLDANQASRAAIAVLASGAMVAKLTGDNLSLTLTLSGNGQADVDATQMLDVALALARRDDAQQAASQALRGAIDAAQTSTELLTIDMAAAWQEGGGNGGA